MSFQTEHMDDFQHECSKAFKAIAKTQRVLVAEDDMVSNKMLYQFLCKFYSCIDSVANGEEAYDMFIHNKYDIVLTDIHMPKMNGFELSAKIREHSKDQKIILVTSDHSQDIVLQASKYNIQHCIFKPIDFNKLIEVFYAASKVN